MSRSTDIVDCLTVDQEVSGFNYSVITYPFRLKADSHFQDVYLSAHYGYIYSLINVEIEGQKYLVTGCKITVSQSR